MKIPILIFCAILFSCAQDPSKLHGDGKDRYRVITYNSGIPIDTTICSGYKQDINQYFLVRKNFIKQISLGNTSTIIVETLE